MAYKIEWSEDATIDYENTVKYIGKTWGINSASIKEELDLFIKKQRDN
ncbi:MAG: hypothetical protein H7A25_21135 [Leptospiraceae bacterium]|nr:hypothetical protein [Leptospiraceae bacterium]MCP5502415.1 hypothetical protein [Leptospiraceae bacterium]